MRRLGRWISLWQQMSCATYRICIHFWQQVQKKNNQKPVACYRIFTVQSTVQSHKLLLTVVSVFFLLWSVCEAKKRKKYSDYSLLTIFRICIHFWQWGRCDDVIMWWCDVMLSCGVIMWYKNNNFTIIMWHFVFASIFGGSSPRACAARPPGLQLRSSWKRRGRGAGASGFLSAWHGQVCAWGRWYIYKNDHDIKKSISVCVRLGGEEEEFICIQWYYRGVCEANSRRSL